MGESLIEHTHLTRCSPALRTATVAVEAWGRDRWPAARVMHELKVGGCRLDIAFVLPDHLIGSEIKSERDTLSRLADQVRAFSREIPELWVAVAQRWLPELQKSERLPWSVGRVAIVSGVVEEVLDYGRFQRSHPARSDEMLTAPMLHLLWRDEAVALAKAHDVRIPARMPLYQIVKVLARRLTGDEIVSGVCVALRARMVGGYPADPASPSHPEPSR